MNVVTRPLADELVMTRDIAAPRERVFAAWTDVRLASRWWVPQDFMPLSCEMDVRPGGAWRRRMRAPDGTVVTKWGVYREIAAPERLVFTYRTESAGAIDAETLVTLTFADLGTARGSRCGRPRSKPARRGWITRAAGPAPWNAW